MIRSAEVQFLAVEGVIGVGKSSLAKLLSEHFNARLIEEEFQENPFLSSFYKDRRHYAFQTQLFFLLSRYNQFSKAFEQSDLFYPMTVSDYSFEKDRVFANATLDETEKQLYDQVAGALVRDVAKPDFIVYLQADVDVLMRRIQKRGREMERDIDYGYLRQLIELYNELFFSYTACPVLIVNTNRIDFVNNPSDAKELLERIGTFPHGINLFNPVSL